MNIDVNQFDSMLQVALKYAELGLRVLPLHTPQANGACSCGKGDCTSTGKHPRTANGVRDATTDGAKINEWWSRWPGANIGIATGAESGIAVLDIDPRHGGVESLASLEEDHGALPSTLKVQTGSGGYHIFFKYPGAGLSNRTGVRDGIDFKMDGGYVVAAPSLHASGGVYQWIINNVDAADMPEWLYTLLAVKEQKSRSVANEEGAIPDGKRNDSLFSLACSMRSKGLLDQEILAALLVVNNRCNPPLAESELESIVRSACEYEAGSIVGGSRAFNQTDVGNSERMVAIHGNDFRYCRTWGKFLIWDGARFKIDDTGQVERLAKDTVRSMYAEAAAISEEGDRKRQAKHALGSENQSRIKAMIELAKSESEIVIVPEALDTDEWLLNTINGTIDLRTGELKPHVRENLITKLVSVQYDPDAVCPTWDACLHKIMGGNNELIRFLQKAIGYSLTGSTREQCMFILYGAGANGKSTFLNTIERLLADYAQQTPTDTLMAKKNEGIRNDVARLKGTRFVTASEAEQGKAMAESLIKQMTGGDKLTARFLHGEFFEFVPKFKLFLATNHKPNIRGVDNGIWRRIRLIPFTVTIPDAERDSDLGDKLLVELPGILRWAVEGCLAWQREGLAAPVEINQATAEYRSDMDWLQAFIDERFVVRSGLKIPASSLYQEYQQWCGQNGEHEYSQRILGMRLKDKGFETRRSGASGSTDWYGLGEIQLVGFTEVTEGTEDDLAISLIN